MAETEVIPLATDAQSLTDRFLSVREMTERLAESLTPEDQMVQSCPDASPTKWHLAHTTWFFETFVLREFLPGYRPLDESFRWLFNSYYKSLGDFPEKRLRASFSRPSLEEVQAYRQHVEDGILQLLGNKASTAAQERIELGMHHEQQHQELILTDIKHAFWSNPLQPSYVPNVPSGKPVVAGPLRWIPYKGGQVEIGHSGSGFGYDNEFSRHPVYLEPYRLASRLVTCAEYLAFMQQDGYRRPELWLSEGWDTITREGWNAPLYWRQCEDGAWTVFTLRGPLPLDSLLASPVCHLSYYEADAYARWAGQRLPTESEWEHAAASIAVDGNLLESWTLHPEPSSSSTTMGEREPRETISKRVAGSGPLLVEPPIGFRATSPSSHATGGSSATHADQPEQMFGDVWEWTQSAYSAYPRYRPAPGALGEYNGKFMCSQMVLRGGSVATPASHIRATYRNFFSPATRWQFSGIRLACDGDMS